MWDSFDKCVFVLARSWSYGVNNKSKCFGQTWKVGYEKFGCWASVHHSLADPFVIHLDSRKHTKYRYYPNVSYLCNFAVFCLSRIIFYRLIFFLFLLVLNSSFSLLGHLFIYSLLFLGDVYTCTGTGFQLAGTTSYIILFRRFSLMKPIGTLSLFFYNI